jgi:hypothetical protein
MLQSMCVQEEIEANVVGLLKEAGYKKDTVPASVQVVWLMK